MLADVLGSQMFLLQVPHPELQHNIMIEAVENHMPVRLFCLIHKRKVSDLRCLVCSW